MTDPNQCGGDQLPAGKTCSDCYHCRRCVGMFGVIAANTTCDFSPSRFVQKPAPPETNEKATP